MAKNIRTLITLFAQYSPTKVCSHYSLVLEMFSNKRSIDTVCVIYTDEDCSKDGSPGFTFPGFSIIGGDYYLGKYDGKIRSVKCWASRICRGNWGGTLAWPWLVG